MIAMATLVVLICWALNRNQHKQIRTISDNGVPDRDLERLVADLRSLA